VDTEVFYTCVHRCLLSWVELVRSQVFHSKHPRCLQHINCDTVRHAGLWWFCQFICLWQFMCQWFCAVWLELGISTLLIPLRQAPRISSDTGAVFGNKRCQYGCLILQPGSHALGWFACSVIKVPLHCRHVVQSQKHWHTPMACCKPWCCKGVVPC